MDGRKYQALGTQRMNHLRCCTYDKTNCRSPVCYHCSILTCPPSLASLHYLHLAAKIRDLQFGWTPESQVWDLISNQSEVVFTLKYSECHYKLASVEKDWILNQNFICILCNVSTVGLKAQWRLGDTSDYSWIGYELLVCTLENKSLKGAVIPGMFILVSTKNVVSVCFLILN